MKIAIRKSGLILLSLLYIYILDMRFYLILLLIHCFFKYRSPFIHSFIHSAHASYELSTCFYLISMLSVDDPPYRSDVSKILHIGQTDMFKAVVQLFLSFKQYFFKVRYFHWEFYCSSVYSEVVTPQA